MATKHVLLALASAFALAGCDSKKQSGPPSSPATNVTAQEVKQEIRVAAETTRAYAIGSKDQFVAAMTVRMQDWDDRIARLDKQIESLGVKAKAEGIKSLDALRDQRLQLSRRLDALRKSGEELEQNVKSGFESAAAEWEKGCEAIKSRFE